MADSVYKILTDQTFELYQSFISSGFTEAQALELTKSQYAFANANYQADYQRRRIDKESRARLLKKFGDATCQE